MYHQTPVNIDQLLTDAIVNYVMSNGGRSRVFSNLLEDLSQYNWRNHVMDTLVATAAELIEMWSSIRGVPKESLIVEVVGVCCDIQSLASAKRNPGLIQTLTYDERITFDKIAAMSAQLNAEIDQFYGSAPANTNTGYRSAWDTAPTASPSTARYTKYAKRSNEFVAQDSTPPVVPTTTTARYRPGKAAVPNAPTAPETTTPKGRQYVIQNKGTNKMSETQTLVYETHRRQTFNPRPADRQISPDFMGALNNNVTVNASVEGNNVEAFDITKMATDVIATCREHAQAIYGILITDAGNVISADAVLEYTYDEVRAIRTLADEDSLRIALLNDDRLGNLRDNRDDLSLLATAIGELVNDPDSQLANAIGRNLNLFATEQINRLLSYDLDLTWRIPDFQAAYSELLAELTKEYGAEKIESILKLVSEDIITRIGTVFTPTAEADEKLCDALNAIHQAEIASRSVFVLRQVHVTHIPANFSNLNLTFEDRIALVDPIKAPDFFVALKALEERAGGDLRKYSKVLLVTEDEVELEIIPTYLTTEGSDHSPFAVKILRS